MRMKPVGRNRYRCVPSGEADVGAVVYLNDALREAVESDALRQLTDAVSLPGVEDPVVGMPDLHVGYGLPIGGVMAVRAGEDEQDTSIVSAGAVGYDINCGVRLLRTNIVADDLDEDDLKALLDAILRRIPVGVGKSSARTIRGLSFEQVVTRGAQALIAEGYGRREDAGAIEEMGSMEGARPETVSKKARSRSNQLATIGGGNHFIEIGTVERVYDHDMAGHFGLAEGDLTVMIHTGSRGFGHEVCSNYTALMSRRASAYGVKLPSKGLACVPIGSREGRDYLAAMACAVNYAFANRQLLTHDVRLAFSEVMGEGDVSLGLDVVYDVAHNIAKFEEHSGRRMLIHRKGATRALPPGHPSNPPRYRDTGHPVIIPGSMGTGSFVTVGTENTRETFYSVNHGAGRVMSRTAARKRFDLGSFREQLGSVIYAGVAVRKVLDEAPEAYKDIDDVVETLAEIDITRKVVRLRPLAVIKGD